MKKILMNSKFKLFIYLLIIFNDAVSRAELVTTYSINSSTVKEIEAWIDKDTIIFIELDDVLVMPKSKMFSYDSNPYRMFIDNLVTLGEKSPDYTKAVANWYGQRKVRLVEEGWVDFLKRARKKGAKIYGLCSMPLQLTNIETLRLKELNELGIIFDSKINNSEELVITREFSWFSRFNKGIVYTGPYSKSKTIIDLFKVANLSPNKLITFANVEHEIKQIDIGLRRFNLYFKNILYLGSREITGTPDPEIVKFQQRELIEKGKWYEDQEASALLDFRQQRGSSGKVEHQ